MTDTTFSLTSLQDLPALNPPTTWLSDQDERADDVARYRRYFDGDHDAGMTTEMKNLLRVSSSSSPFSPNLCPVIINTENDRLEVTAIEAEEDTASEWADTVLEANRFDGLQGIVHESALRDADTFLMVTYDSDLEQVVLTHEHAYDGTSGVLALYRSIDDPQMAAAIKIWSIDEDKEHVRTRVNVYYPDRLERYSALDGGALTAYADEANPPVVTWLDSFNQPLGIPIIHFRNRGRHNYGASELKSAIPLQDALNRTLHSLVLNSEYTAFSVLFAAGFSMSAVDMRPGSLINVAEGGLTNTQQVILQRIPAGSNAEFLSAAQWLVDMIGRITRTPSPEFMAPTSSGEARKQAEVGLIGKVRRAQIQFGNAWEQTMDMAWKVQDTFGTEKPPEYTRWYCRWRDPELRNDNDIVDNALKLQEIVGPRETLRLMGSYTGYDESKIEQILDEKQADSAQAMNLAIAQLPGFEDRTNGLPIARNLPPGMAQQAGQMMTGDNGQEEDEI